jgi:phosphate starvation-inducible protein PhoH
MFNTATAYRNDDYSDNLVDNYTVERKRAKRQRKESKKNSGLQLNNISPLTDSQRKVFEAYDSGFNIMMHGCAGTGKTFTALYLALESVLNHREQNNIQIIRSVVPTRDMGFLPGNSKEKSKAYEAPYYSIFTDLFGRGDAYDCLKNKNIVDFQTTSFIRGLTFDNSCIIVDECQNLTFHELDSVITRMGENSRVVFCGDFNQSDFKWDDEKRGIRDFMRVLSHMKQFASVEFDRDDIVRSDLVKDYICAKLDLGIT